MKCPTCDGRGYLVQNVGTRYQLCPNCCGTGEAESEPRASYFSLLDCPFCGSSYVQIRQDGAGRYWVCCVNCGAQARSVVSQGNRPRHIWDAMVKAATAWNWRNN